MELLFALSIIIALIWLMVAARIMSPVAGCLLVIVTGVVLGHPYWNINIGPLPVTLDRVMWGGLIFIFLMFGLTRRNDLKPVNRTDIFVVFLGLVLIAGTLACDWRYRDNMPLSRLLFFNLMPMGFYFLGKHCRLDPRQLIVGYALLALFGGYLGVVGIAEQRQWTALVFPRYITDPSNFEFLGRARGPFLNPVALGLYLTTCLAATAGLWRYCHPLLRVGLVAMMATMLAACFLTFTRSVWLGAAVTVGVICWFPSHRQIRGALIVAGTMVLLATLILFSDKLNRFQRDKYVTAAEMAESVALRPMLARVAWNMFLDRPVLGHGFGQYTAAKKPYHYVETADMPLRKVLPYMQHNVFLSYLTETGLVGMSLLVLLLGSATVKGWKLWYSRDLPWAERYFGLVILAFVANYCINGMFHDVSIIPHTAAIWFLLLGIVENLTAQQQRAMTSAGGDPRTGDDSRLLLAA